MEQIRELFEETKGLESLAKMFRDTKREIFQLQTEIEALKEEKNSLQLHELNRKIADCENELNSISKEVDCGKIMENKCLSLEDLKRALDLVIDENICLEKCFEFMNSLVITFNISGLQLERVFGLVREEDYFKVIKINGEIEDLFRMSKLKGIYTNLSTEFKSRISKELEGAVPFDTEIFTSGDSFYITLPAENLLTTDEIAVSSPTQVSFSSFSSTFPATASGLLFLLQTNLSHAFLRDNYTKEDLLANNEKLQGTSFHLDAIEEWALDIAMKEVVAASKAKMRPNDLCLVEGGKFISGPYAKLIKLKKFITNSNSTRKEKANAFYDKTMLKFFDLSRVTDPDCAFLMYSDLSHFTKKFPDFSHLEELSKAREELFYLIMSSSTNVNVDLKLSILQLKARIKQRQIDFNENIEKFISTKTEKFFKIQFFEKLYDSFIEDLLGYQTLSAGEINLLKELSQYLLDLSFEIGSDLISNYKKLGAVYECLDSSLDELIEIHQYGLHLEDSELVVLVNLLFPDSEQRRSFLAQLGGKMG